MRASNPYAGLCALLSTLACVHCASDAAAPLPISAAGQASAGAPTSTAGAAGLAQGGESTAGASGAAGSNGGGGAAPAAAGASSAGAGAAGSAGTATSDACAGRTICEGFEQLALGSEPKAPFSIHKNKGTVTVDGTHVHSGKQALKVSVTATATGDTSRQAMLAITGAPLLPLSNDSLYGRFMIYTDRIPDKTVHWTFAHGDGPYQDTTATYNYGGMGGLMANYYRNTLKAGTSDPLPTDCWQSNNQVFPTGRWVCVAFHFDGPNNEMQFWIDGAEISDLHVLGNSKTTATCVQPSPADGVWHAPTPFKNISVGWESYQHDVAGAHDAWIDDLVLDESAIDCPH